MLVLLHGVFSSNLVGSRDTVAWLDVTIKWMDGNMCEGPADGNGRAWNRFE